MRNKITIKPKKLLLILTVVALSQFVIYLLVAHIKPDSMYRNDFWDLLNIDQESSIFTWYSQFLFLIPAFIMIWLAIAAEKRKDKVYWSALSVILLYLSIDDGAAVHERFWIITKNTGMAELVSTTSFSNLFYYPWLMIGIVLVLVSCAVFAKFFFSLPLRTKLLLALSASTFLAGAVGVEMYTSYVIATTGEAVPPIVIGAEETLEILGVSLSIYALLDYIKHLTPKSKRSLSIEVDS